MIETKRAAVARVPPKSAILQTTLTARIHGVPENSISRTIRNIQKITGGTRSKQLGLFLASGSVDPVVVDRRQVDFSVVAWPVEDEHLIERFVLDGFCRCSLRLIGPP